MEIKYTDEKNVLILIALLKANGIKRVIVSPGTTNMTFVASLQHDDFFTLYSCIDERSAAYMACGMAEETNEPIVITCTGATASRNYMPGLTEAFYRKLPIVAVCGHRGISQIANLQDQQLDRRIEPNDVAKLSVWLPIIKDVEDENYCITEANRALVALRAHGGGPVIINLCTHYSQNMNVECLPNVKMVHYHSENDEFPALPKGRIAIMAGSHTKYTKEETAAIDAFCASCDSVVFCDHTSGYYGKYAVYAGLFGGQKAGNSLLSADLVIRIGEISGDNMGGLRLWSSEMWRVCGDGQVRNPRANLTHIFDMDIETFCQHYIVENADKHSYLDQCISAYNDVYCQIPELPFGNIWIAQNMCKKLPTNASLYLGIYNSLRSWNLFQLPKRVDCTSNVGGFGIDGTLSSVVGRSLVNPNRLAFCVLGDLAFFYDMNALGNRHITNNLRILVINNGLGDEFRIYDNPTGFLGEEVVPYIAAGQHYGNQSPIVIKNYVESLGYKYLSAKSKEEFLMHVDEFVSNTSNAPIVFEAFVKKEDDTDALDMIKHIVPIPNKSLSMTAKLKHGIKDAIGSEKIEAIRTLLK